MFNSFVRFYTRVLAAHFSSYVVVGAISYLLIMRHVWHNFPADAALYDVTSSHVQFWLWPAQFVRALVLAGVLFPLRERLMAMGHRGGLMVAGIMIGIGCLGGFNGLIENLIFYRNVSLYLYYVHIPEIVAQTLSFGYGLMYLEARSAESELIGLRLS